MFKRVAKRMQKRAEIEDLGLDEDERNILEEQETDSDESTSDSDEDSDVHDDAGVGEYVDGDDYQSSESIMMTMEEVRDNPFVGPSETGKYICAVCPLRQFSKPDSKEALAHKPSRAHSRRLEKICKTLSNMGPGPADISRVVASINFQDKEHERDPDTPSKRQEKSNAKLEQLRAKRERRKQSRKRRHEREEKGAQETAAKVTDTKNSSADKPASSNTNKAAGLHSQKKRHRPQDDASHQNQVKAETGKPKKKKRKLEEGAGDEKVAKNGQRAPLNENEERTSLKKDRGVMRAKKERNLTKKDGAGKKNVARYFEKDNDSQKSRKEKGGVRRGGNLDSKPLLRVFE